LEASAKDGQRRLDIGQAVGEGLSLAQGLIQTGKGFEGVPGTFDRLSDPLNVFAKEQARMESRDQGSKIGFELLLQVRGDCLCQLSKLQ